MLAVMLLVYLVSACSESLTKAQSMVDSERVLIYDISDITSCLHIWELSRNVTSAY